MNEPTFDAYTPTPMEESNLVNAPIEAIPIGFVLASHLTSKRPASCFLKLLDFKNTLFGWRCFVVVKLPVYDSIDESKNKSNNILRTISRLDNKRNYYKIMRGGGSKMFLDNFYNFEYILIQTDWDCEYWKYNLSGDIHGYTDCLSLSAQCIPGICSIIDSVHCCMYLRTIYFHIQ